MQTALTAEASADGGEGADEVGEGAFFLPRELRHDLEASAGGRASISSRRCGATRTGVPGLCRPEPHPCVRNVHVRCGAHTTAFGCKCQVHKWQRARRTARS